MRRFELGKKIIGDGQPTYFIADIGANHDGSLERAKELIHLAAEAGADAAKFQNFHASQIVSDYGFRKMGDRLSHQAKWKKSVFEVYEQASVPDDWTPVLKEECDSAGVEYFSSPYDFDAIELLEPFVPAFKVGSGDIDWWESLHRMSSTGKPVLFATGASTIGEVQSAMDVVRANTEKVVLMQCNTNYTGADANFDHVHLNVLRTYSAIFPDVVLGLSDHTPGHATVLGAVALGARVIEKHFTDDNDREGPDHPFAMDPAAWREMVDRTRELERALGSTEKFIAANEQATKYVQRRCLRASQALEPGTVITREMIDVLRPATDDGIKPPDIGNVIGKRAATEIPAGEAFTWSMLVE